MANPPNKFQKQIIKNNAGETLTINYIYTVFDKKYFDVDSEDGRIFEYLVEQPENIEEFFNFILGHTLLTETEFIELINRFGFSFPQADMDTSINPA